MFQFVIEQRSCSLLEFKKGITLFLLFIFLAGKAYTESGISAQSTKPDLNFSFCTTWHSFLNFGEEETNIHMYEFHFGYKLTSKDKIEVKFATWELFEPLGIQLWDSSHLLQESSYYPGRLQEYGIGLCYQRILWKGLFAAIEILPLMQSYLDENNDKLSGGFRLYTSYHLGYQFSFFHERVFITPQIQCNYWPIMTDGPDSFKSVEKNNWNKNIVLFEPNIYIGINF